MTTDKPTDKPTSRLVNLLQPPQAPTPGSIENLRLEGFDNIHAQRTPRSLERATSPRDSDEKPIPALQHLPAGSRP